MHAKAANESIYKVENSNTIIIIIITSLVLFV